MAIWARHPRTDLLRYLTGEVEGDEKLVLEAHLTSCEDCRNFLSFVRDFRAGLSELTGEEFTTREPCPDAWTIVTYERGEADEETARRLRVHLLLCDACAEEHYALQRLRPKAVEVVLGVAGHVFHCRWISDFVTWANPARAVATMGAPPMFVAPFEVIKTLQDPHTGGASTLKVRAERSLEPEAIRLVVMSEPAPERTWGWRVCLLGTEDLPEVDIPLMTREVEVSADLTYGLHALEVRKDDECLQRLAFTFEPLNMRQAIDAALEYLEIRQYSRAIAILTYAAERYPESREVSDLLVVARGLAVQDPDGFEAERGAGREVRSFRDFLHETREALNRARAKFGERLAPAVAAATLDPASLPQDVKVLESQQVCMEFLQELKLLNERIRVSGEGQAQLIEVVNRLVLRLDGLEASFGDLTRAVDALRRDTGTDPDKKFAEAGALFDRFAKEVAEKGLSPLDVAPVFREQIGETCWSWLGEDVARMFVWAEAVYHFLRSKPFLYAADFSPALLQFCRGLELLLNTRLRDLCGEVRDVVTQNMELRKWAAGELPGTDVIRAFQREPGNQSITDVMNALRIGKVVARSRPGAFADATASLLTATGAGLTDIEVLVPLGHVGLVFRNGKIHPRPGSTDMFTTVDEVRILRKLLFGFDEEHADTKLLFDRLADARWLTESERRKAVAKLRADWRSYPGFLRLLWEGLQRSSIT